jgi:cytochrome bd-type quinol oxidase subunit 2
MITEIFANLGIVGMLAFVMACLVLANVVIGLYYNIGKKNQAFDGKKFVSGLLKGAAILTICCLIAIAFTVAPYAFANTGQVIDQELAQTISMGALYLILIGAIAIYGTKILNNLRKVFGINIDKPG